jgi:hypothetical protein
MVDRGAEGGTRDRTLIARKSRQLTRNTQSSIAAEDNYLSPHHTGELLASIQRAAQDIDSYGSSCNG